MGILEIFGDEDFTVFFDEFGVDVLIDQEDGDPIETRGILEAPGQEDSSGVYSNTNWSLIVRTSEFVENGIYESYTINRGQKLTVRKRNCEGKIIDGTTKRFECVSALMTELPDGATARISLEAYNCQP